MHDTLILMKINEKNNDCGVLYRIFGYTTIVDLFFQYPINYTNIVNLLQNLTFNIVSFYNFMETPTEHSLFLNDFQ